MSEDDVFFQPHQIIRLAGQGCFRQNLGRFLETGRRDETGTLHRGFRDAQQLRAAGGCLGPRCLGRFAAERFDLVVGLLQDFFGNDGARGEFGVALVGDLHALGQILVDFAEIEPVHHQPGQ